MNLSWDQWYSELTTLAGRYRESVADESAWRESYDDGFTVEAAFFDEYPEHAPTAKQHATPCNQCPWRRNSAPGYLGASNPGEFLQTSDNQVRMPCHLHVDYEREDWKDQAERAPQCAGRATFQANRCQLPDPGLLRLPKDVENVFQWPHEFVEHHARMAKGEMLGKLVYDLYAVQGKYSRDA